MKAQVLGISVDPVPTLKAWAADLGGVSFPLLSDFWPHGAASEQYGVLGPEGTSERAIFLLDKEGALRYQRTYHSGVQPDNDEILSEVRTIEHGDEAPVEAGPGSLDDAPAGGIVMYCSAYCIDCRKARAWLDEVGLEYYEVDVYRVEGASERVRGWNDDNLVLPTFEIEGRVLPNFDPEALTRLLRELGRWPPASGDPS